ncbi:hypothetical protein [Sphingomonas sp. 22176]|uniref:hypothetical protein n=1 Tax=Sphingomonas sp. 22176 TaxID=3453884 RepID=UPI003F86CA5C
MAEARDEDPDWEKIVAKMREARSMNRGYASNWEWAPDRQLAEAGVVQALADYLTEAEGASWTSIIPISDDPPDALLSSTDGRRIGVEVTEIVDEKMVKWHRHKKALGQSYPYHWATWNKSLLETKLSDSVTRKDKKLYSKRSNYDELFVIAYTDEPIIDIDLARLTISDFSVDVDIIDRAFLLLSYTPNADVLEFPRGIPVFPIPLRRAW